MGKYLLIECSSISNTNAWNIWQKDSYMTAEDWDKLNSSLEEDRENFYNSGWSYTEFRITGEVSSIEEAEGWLYNDSI